MNKDIHPYKPPFPTKYRLGDRVKYCNEIWTIDDWCLVQNDEYAYDISRPFKQGRKIMGVNIKKADKDFIKIEN